MHFNSAHALALAGFTSSTFDIERKSSDGIAPNFCFRYAGVHLANMIENPCICRWIRSWSSSNRGLIYFDHSIDLVESVHRRMLAGNHAHSRNISLRSTQKNIAHQGALAAPGDSCHTDKTTKRKGNVNTFQIICARTLNRDCSLCFERSALCGNWNGESAAEIFSSDALGCCADICERTLRNNQSAMATRPWSNIDQMISCANGVFIMLDDENGVADGGKPAKRRD